MKFLTDEIVKKNTSKTRKPPQSQFTIRDLFEATTLAAVLVALFLAPFESNGKKVGEGIFVALLIGANIFGLFFLPLFAICVPLITTIWRDDTAEEKSEFWPWSYRSKKYEILIGLCIWILINSLLTFYSPNPFNLMLLVLFWVVWVSLAIVDMIEVQKKIGFRPQEILIGFWLFFNLIAFVLVMSKFNVLSDFVSSKSPNFIYCTFFLSLYLVFKVLFVYRRIEDSIRTEAALRIHVCSSGFAIIWIVHVLAQSVVLI